LAELFMGPIADIPGVRDMWGKEQRASASPLMARLMWQAVAEIDVRGVLGSVRTPTLVLTRRGDRIAAFEGAVELAERIPNAELQEFAPGEHYASDLVDLFSDLVPARPPTASRSAQGCTSASARSAATSGAGWPCTSVPGSARWPVRARC
jgi:hypothetical protein